MNLPSILKKKSTYIVLAILIVGGGLYVRSRSTSSATYVTTAAKSQELLQTVEVTGEITPASRIDLAFQSNGTLDKLNVKVGDVVKAGDVLATLKSGDLQFAVQNAQASLANAQASLRQRLAGSTPQAIAVSQAQVEQAKAAYDKAVADLASTQSTSQDAIQTASIAQQTAQNNLNNQGAIIAQNLANSIDSARLSLLTALGPLNTALTDGDQITSVDNTASNQNFSNVLGFLDAGSLPTAKNAYVIAKTSSQKAELSVRALSNSSTQDQIASAALQLQDAITLVQTYLSDVQKVLAASLTNSNSFTPAILAAYQSTNSSDRTSVSAQNTAVLTAQQTIKNSALTQTQTAQQLRDAFTNAQTAYNTAVTNASVQVRNAQTNISIQKAALDSAQASLDLQKSPPREVDVASLRASVDGASVALGKARNDLLNSEIIASVSGTVAEIIPDVGQQITALQPEIRIVTTQGYDIQASVPEADIVKIALGQPAMITLDSYGDEVKFSGTVTGKDPAETRIQDAIYYKINVQIDPAGREIKPGMTANVTIITGDQKNALVIPLRAVHTDANGQKTVRTLVNNQPVTHTVVLGLHGDDGLVEITSGLTANDAVITDSTP